VLRSLKVLGFFGAIASIFLGAISSTAQIFQGQNIFRDVKGNIYLTNQSPGASIKFHFQGLKVERNISTNECGLMVIKPLVVPDGFNYFMDDMPIILNGNNVSTEGMQNLLIPSCINGQLSESRPSSFYSGSAIVLSGLQPNSIYKVGLFAYKARSVTANACGIAKLSNSLTSPFNDLTNFSIDPNLSSGYTFPQLATASVIPKCYKVEGISRTFIPVGVPGW